MTTKSTDEAAQIIANMDPWHQENLNCVAVALSWLKAHDHPGLWLNAQVRHLMEGHPL